MQFSIPDQTIQFEIPDEWWTFAEMEGFTPGGGGYFLPQANADWEVVPIGEVEPPMRNIGVPLFKKYKMVPVLFAFQSPECALPPVEVYAASEGPYRFKVRNGCHRYYASIAVGFSKLPVKIGAQPSNIGGSGSL